MKTVLAILLATQLAFAAQTPSRRAPVQHKPSVLRATVNLVVIDVEVTDSSGRPVKGLQASDFTLYENGKAQKISTFVYANVEGFAQAEAGKTQAPIVVPVGGSESKSELGPVVQNRRMILMFFDLTSLATPDLMRARAAAIHYVKDQMSPADLVGIVVLGGGSILLGLFPVVGFWLIVAFLVGTTPMMHGFWSVSDPGQRAMEQIQFMKNVALLGAALMMIVFTTYMGPWPFRMVR